MLVRRSKDPALAQSSAIALRVAIVFLFVGAAWVLLTDLLLYQFVHDPLIVGRLETAKGWSFVAFATATLYVVADRAVRKLARSDATLRAVVTSISDAVFLIELDGTIRSANPTAARLLGIEDPQQLVGVDGRELARRLHITLPNGQVVDPSAYVTERALAGEQPPPYKAVLHPPRHADIVAILTGAPVRSNPCGSVDLAVCVVHDITYFESLNKMRDEFLASAAHTLRTPVAIINAHIHLIASGHARSIQAATEVIERQCSRITRLTENLLVLARLRSETLRLDPDPIDLAEVVGDAMREMEPAATEHPLHARVFSHPTVFADRQRLSLVIRNMIELVFRRSRPKTDVTLDIDMVDHSGRVSVAYQPLDYPDVDDHECGFEGLGLERYVIAEVVRATSGKLGSDTDGDDLRRDWLEIPIIEDHTHG